MSAKIIKFLKYLFFGISWGCTFFVIALIIVASTLGEEVIYPNLTEQAIGSIIIGIACGTTPIVYTFERLPIWLKIPIHFTIGLSTFFAVSFHLGWLKFSSGLVWLNVLQIFIAIFFFVSIWFAFYFYNKNEAKKINKRLKDFAESE